MDKFINQRGRLTTRGNGLFYDFARPPYWKMIFI